MKRIDRHLRKNLNHHLAMREYPSRFGIAGYVSDFVP